MCAMRVACTAPSTSSQNRRAFSCAHCGDHIYPTAGTVFQDTRTPLLVWFYAIYLFRHYAPRRERQGATAHARRHVQNARGVWASKSAMLMAKADGFEMLKGHVESGRSLSSAAIARQNAGIGTQQDDCSRHGRARRPHRRARSIPDVTTPTLRGIVLLKTSNAGPSVSTDELRIVSSYSGAMATTITRSIIHKKQWRKFNYRREEYHHTNSVEGFWRLFKNSIRSTHIHVSAENTWIVTYGSSLSGRTTAR